MKKLSKQKREQLIMVAVGAVIVCAALWYLLIQSLNESLAAVAKQNKDLGEKISGAETQLKKAPAIEARYFGASNLLSEVEGTMPSGDMYTWIITTIHNFTAPYKDISIPTFSPGQLGEVEMFPVFPYKAATFHLKGTAHYDDFGRLASDFENHFPFFMIQNIELIPTRQPSPDDLENLDFSLDVIALAKPSGP
jgi:hypothetical protein